VTPAHGENFIVATFRWQVLSCASSAFETATIEDATQDVFLEMFRYLPRFRGESELSTWLYRLCITQARRVRTPSRPDDVARHRIEQALAALTETERTVFVLYEMEGVPGKQIAQIVSCPEATVWRRLHYARHAFRRALGEESA
jgi:RNA polymerase sigma-70 factor, ECF subfamily